MGSERLYAYGRSATNFRALAVLLKGFKDWSMGHMYAEFGVGLRTLGQLPHEYTSGPQSVFASEYIVYSYLTPIAWVVNGEWVQPEVKYSNTTTKHQSKIAVAVSVLSEVEEENVDV